MADLLNLFKDFGPYIFLPVVVYYVVNWLKTSIPFFKTVNGLRLVHFLPLVLGSLGGILLPEDDLGSKLLTGGGLGCLNLLIYKFVTVTIAKKADVQAKIDKKK